MALSWASKEYKNQANFPYVDINRGKELEKRLFDMFATTKQNPNHAKMHIHFNLMESFGLGLLQEAKIMQKMLLGEDIEVDGSTSQKKLCANLVAQIVAFACGKSDSDPNKTFDGERPSSLIHGKQLNPESMGALLAHFENKIMFQGFLWNLNSFDQEGVQLGKKLTKQVLAGEVDGALKAYSEIFDI